MLAITEAEFDEIYAELPILIYKHIFYTTPSTDHEFEVSYLSSKLWRLNNLYTIVDKKGQRIPFQMNRSQHKIHAAQLFHPRLIILKSRQQGISTYYLVTFFDDCCFVSDCSIGLMAQGRDEAATLLNRTKTLWETLDPVIKEYLDIGLIRDSKTELALNNGSTIFIRTSFRSATLQRLHVSELGKIANKYPERARETKTGTLQAIAPGNPVGIESTAEGVNTFKGMWDTAMMFAGILSGRDFKPIFLSWLDDPDCVNSVDQESSELHDKYFSELEERLSRDVTQEQRNFWLMMYRELGDDIYQEYPATPEEAFLVTRKGTYWAKIFLTQVKLKGHIKSELYDPNLDVWVSCDLGKADYFVLVFFQRYKEQYRIIDEYKASGEAISHYVNVMKSKPYLIDHLILPHDANVQELNWGQTRADRFRELGCRNITVLERTDLMDGIEAVRTAMPDFWVDPKCEYLISCMLSYTREWDPHHEIWKDNPLKSNKVHGADGVRYMVVGSPTELPRGREERSSGMDV